MKTYNAKLMTGENVRSENPYETVFAIVSDLNDARFGLNKNDEKSFADFLVNSLYIEDWIDGIHELLSIYILEIITLK